MTSTVDTSPCTIWEALDRWGQGLAPWQRYILSMSVESGRLTDDQIDTAHELFLKAFNLKEDVITEISGTITGRPSSGQLAPLQLERIDGLAGINALPDAAC